MAKIKFTAIVADMRNKLNGTVFAKNRGGSYARTKVTPVNRQTTFQSAVRNRLGTFAQSFRGLTASQIAAWNSAVDNFKSTDIFGDIKVPSGINLYTKLNTILASVGVASINTPPLPIAVTPVTAVSAVADASDNDLEVTFAPGTIPAGMALIISATKQKSPGQSFFGGQYAQIGFVDAAGTSPETYTTEYTNRFGSLIVGQKIGVKVQMVSKVTGQAGIPLTATCVVQA